MLAGMQAIAHGSDSVLYFQWRKGRGGYEKFHGAVLDHKNGTNTRVFREVTELGERLAGCLLYTSVNQRAIFTNRGKAPELTESIENIIEIMRRGEPFYQEEAEGEMLAFLSKIARENGNIQGGGSVNMREKAKISNLVSRSLDYISDHYREQIKVGDIAKRLHLSETHFRRVFTQYMGVSPLE